MHTNTEARDYAAIAGAHAVQRGDTVDAPSRDTEGAMSVHAEIDPLSLIGLATDLRLLAIDKPHRAGALNALADAVDIAEQNAASEFEALVDGIRGAEWVDLEARR